MMKLVDQIERLKKRKEQRASGKHFAVEISGMKKLTDNIIGIEPKTLYAVTADTGVGKSKFVLQMLRGAFHFSKKHNIDFKVIYFMLEGDKFQMADRLMALLLTEKKLFISPKILNSTKRELPDDVLEKIEELHEEFDWIMERMIIVDDEYNPTGIYKTVRHYALRWGMKAEKLPGKTVYTPAKDSIFLVVVDHINLFNPEKDSETGEVLNRYRAIQKWVSHYCLKHIVKNWHISVLNVIQQAADGSKSHYTNRGTVIVEKVEPSLNGMGNNKEIARDHDVILGLFNPDKHGLQRYCGYNVPQLRKTMRSVKILKNRDGEDFRKIVALFEGASGRFYEVPWGNNLSDEKKEAIYSKATQLFTSRIS